VKAFFDGGRVKSETEPLRWLCVRQFLFVKKETSHFAAIKGFPRRK
jgi:hypothetical protein